MMRDEEDGEDDESETFVHDVRIRRQQQKRHEKKVKKTIIIKHISINSTNSEKKQMQSNKKTITT
jgi:hypothetical protein